MNYFEDNYNTSYPDCKEKKPPTGCQSVYAGTTNSSRGQSTISLTGFQNVYNFMGSGNTSGYDEANGKDSKISYKGCTWRLYEKGYNLTYGTGTIDTNGNLVGLPSSFTANNGYDGNMYIEICCS